MDVDCKDGNQIFLIVSQNSVWRGCLLEGNACFLLRFQEFLCLFALNILSNQAGFFPLWSFVEGFLEFC